MKNRLKYRENVRPPGVKVMDLSSFQDLTSKAQARSRLRQHLNPHTSYDEHCQRFLNAIEPDSYIRPHRHEFRSTTEVETLLVLQGSVALIVFDDDGVLEFSVVFGQEFDSKIMEIGSMIWHTVIALESGTIIFEIKQGPFVESRAKYFASWAPAEGTTEATKYLADLMSRI
jgi:cupin fold WbuC family metalloprotein